MSVRTETGQSPGTKWRVGLPQLNRPKREALLRRNPLRDVDEHPYSCESRLCAFRLCEYRISDTFGRIRHAGYSRIIQSACISVLRCLPGTSAFDQVDDGAVK
jgi:hypothetical protein